MLNLIQQLFNIILTILQHAHRVQFPSQCVLSFSNFLVQTVQNAPKRWCGRESIDAFSMTTETDTFANALVWTGPIIGSLRHLYILSRTQPTSWPQKISVIYYFLLFCSHYIPSWLIHFSVTISRTFKSHSLSAFLLLKSSCSCFKLNLSHTYHHCLSSNFLFLSQEFLLHAKGAKVTPQLFSLHYLKAKILKIFYKVISRRNLLNFLPLYLA